MPAIRKRSPVPCFRLDIILGGDPGLLGSVTTFSIPLSLWCTLESRSSWAESVAQQLGKAEEGGHELYQIEGDVSLLQAQDASREVGLFS